MPGWSSGWRWPADIWSPSGETVRHRLGWQPTSRSERRCPTVGRSASGSSGRLRGGSRSGSRRRPPTWLSSSPGPARWSAPVCWRQTTAPSGLRRCGPRSRPAPSQPGPGPHPVLPHTPPMGAGRPEAPGRTHRFRAGRTGSAAKRRRACGKTGRSQGPPRRCRYGRSSRSSPPGRAAPRRAPGRRSDRVPAMRTWSLLAARPPPEGTCAPRIESRLDCGRHVAARRRPARVSQPSRNDFGDGRRRPLHHS
jgi:hypothetical protein